MAMEPGLTQQLLQRSSDMRMFARSARITLRHAITGESICLPGVATFENGWTVPGDYGVDSLLAHGGVLVFKVREDGTVDSSSQQFRVSAVLISEFARPAPGNYRLCECASADNVVQVIFGAQVVQFAGLPCEDRKCADVSDVETPPTPPMTD